MLACLITYSYCSFRVFGTGAKEALPLADFLTAVGHLKFRGTSVLFRLPSSVMTNIKKQAYVHLNMINCSSQN